MTRTKNESQGKPNLNARFRLPENLNWIWILTILTSLELLYVIYGSAGHMFVQWPIYQAYYDMLADGFRAGHLYINYAPNPELLAASDPWNMKYYRLWLVDGTYYAGHYYIYWGPVPALVQAGVKSLLGIDRIIGDQYITFASFSLLTICSCRLIYKMANRLFTEVPRTLIALSIIAVGCANPVMHLIATGGVYQGAISSAQAFLVMGLMFAFDAVWCAAYAKSVWPYLLAAGGSWGLSLGCRFSHAPTVGLLMLGTVAAVHFCSSDALKEPTPSSPRSHRKSWRRLLKEVVAHSALLGLPVLICVLTLLVYNKLRFDEFLEFGTTWMTTSLKFRLSFDYWVANIYAYLLQTFEFNGEFPYIHQMTHFGKSGVPSWIEFPEGLLMDEPVVGVLKAVPLSWLALVPVFVLVKKMSSRGSRKFEARERLYLVHFVGFFIIGVVGSFPALGVFITTMRYMADFSHGFMLMGVLGGFSLYRLATQIKPNSLALRSLAGAGFSALAIATILFGLAFGYTGYNQHFKRFNPQLHESLVLRLSFNQK